MGGNGKRAAGWKATLLNSLSQNTAIQSRDLLHCCWGGESSLVPLEGCQDNREMNSRDGRRHVNVGPVSLPFNGEADLLSNYNPCSRPMWFSEPELNPWALATPLLLENAAVFWPAQLKWASKKMILHSVWCVSRKRGAATSYLAGSNDDPWLRAYPTMHPWLTDKCRLLQS